MSLSSKLQINRRLENAAIGLQHHDAVVSLCRTLDGGETGSLPDTLSGYPDLLMLVVAAIKAVVHDDGECPALYKAAHADKALLLRQMRTGLDGIFQQIANDETEIAVLHVRIHFGNHEIDRDINLIFFSKLFKKEQPNLRLFFF